VEIAITGAAEVCIAKKSVVIANFKYSFPGKYGYDCRIS
jgi:hypothetical protein